MLFSIKDIFRFPFQGGVLFSNDHDEDSGTPASHSSDDAQNLDSVKEHNILLVEDDPDISMIVRDQLNWMGYGNRTATGVSEANTILETNPPDLILLDLRLPDGSGMEIIDYVRSNERLKDIPIVVISGFGQEETIREALGRGANEFLVKPVTSKTLQAVITSLLTTE